MGEEERAQVQAEMEAWEAAHPHDPEQLITISVVWHSIRTSAGANGATSTMIQDSINVLNGAFVPSGFQFGLAGTTTTNSDTYYSAGFGSSAQTAMKTALRQGDQAALNVYSNGVDQVSGTLGWATFPNDYSSNPTDDGVVIGTQTCPGGTNSPFNLGDTLVHEVGHWLLLYHTFQSGCSGSGDFVDDTPAQASPSSGCPVGTDSCTTGSPDLVNNFMDYSDDSCMNQFTSGQMTRMTTAWNTYRASGTPLPTAPIVPTTPTPTTVIGPGSPTIAPTCGSACFSESATIPVQNQGPIEMPKLVHGDKVLTANGYQTLYGFAHEDIKSPTEFLQIHTKEYPDKPLEITTDHLLFVVGKLHAVPSQSIKQGDRLQSTQWPDGAEVTKVTLIYKSGIYAPMTTDGTMVVDGIVSSCYVTLQSNAREFVELQGGYSIGMSQHFAIHLALTPVRMLCLGISPELCKAQDQRGFAYFAKIGIAAAKWGDSLSLPMQLTLLPGYLGASFALYGLECLFGPKLAVWVVFAAISAIVGAGVNRSSKKKVD